MSGLYQVGQLVFALFVLALIAERTHLLFWRAPASRSALDWLAERLRAGDIGSVRAFAHRLPEVFAARLLLAAEAKEEGQASVELARVELVHAASARLGLLRGCATIASALGLLGAILAIRRGFGPDAGLLALQAGLAQQMALAHALEMMAIGIGTSAVCFHALSVFRGAARDLIAQGTLIAHLLAEVAADADLASRSPRS